MAKLFKKILLSAVVLCLSLGAAIFAAACKEEQCDYSVTVACAELTEEQLDTLGVKLVGSDGKATEGKTLKNARADFLLAPATYTVELYGDLLENYTYAAATVTKEKPDVTVTLSPKTPATVTYTVKVTGAEDVSVKLLKEDGTDATEAKALVNGSVSFDLAPATYKVKLVGDALDNYTYTEPTLTADSPSATVALSPKPAAKVVYTVTVTCESVPSILDEITVKVFPAGSDTAAAAQTLTNGSASFSLAPGEYTVTLSDARGMLADFDYDSDIKLTASVTSVTVALTPKAAEPDGSEDNPYVRTTLAGDYTFTPQKIETEQGWETYVSYTQVYYTYTPAADETYTFTTSVNYLWLNIEDENGETVLDNLSGDNRFYKVFTLTAGTKYTMYAQVDDGNSVYHDGDALTWKIESGEKPQSDVTFTVTVTCDDETLLAKLKVGLYGEDGALASEEKALENGSVSFTLAPATYTVKLSGEGLDEYSYAEKTVSQTSPTAEIKLTKKSDVKVWQSGKGTESDPYVVDPLTGKYSVPTNEFDSVYIKFTAAAEGDYILTTEDDSLYMIMEQGDETLVQFYYEGTDSAHPFHVAAGLVIMEVKNFYETNAPVTFTITRSDGSFDPEKAPASDLTAFVGTWADEEDAHKVVITENSIAYSENGEPYDTTMDGLEDGVLKFTYTEVIFGQEEESHYGVAFNGDALVLVNLDSTGTSKDYYKGYYIVSTLSKQGEVAPVKLPPELTGIWTGKDEDETIYTLTFDDLNVTYAMGTGEEMMALPGTVTSYDATTHTLTLLLSSGLMDMPLELVYDPAAHTLTDEMFGVVLSKQGEVAPVKLPPELTGVWTGKDDEDMVYELTFDDLNVTLVANKGGGEDEMTFTGKATAYDATSKQLTVTFTSIIFPLPPIDFAFDPTAMTLTCSDMFPVTLTKQGSASEQDGTEAHPFVWEAFEGTLEVDLPAGSDQGVPSVYYSYTAKKSGIYSLTYTLNGESYTDLNLIIYPEGGRQRPVASWNTFNQSYAFPLTEGTTYIFRLTDNSATVAGGKLVLTVTEEPLSFPTAYEGTWVDADTPTYTVIVNGTTVTVNGQAVTGLTLAPFNGGYDFVWNDKNCNIAIGKTQSGGYESSMIFTFGEGEDDYVTLYHPGSVPAVEYGTEEHPQPMAQSDLAKDWSDSLSNGEYYWTFTATETKTYTLTTTIDYLYITITDTTAKKAIVSWYSSENVKKAVFEITAGHTYVINYTDSDNDGMRFKTVTFKIAEGGASEQALLPQELFGLD